MKQKVNVWIGAGLIFSVGVLATYVIIKAANASVEDFKYLPTTHLVDYGDDL